MHEGRPMRHSTELGTPVKNEGEFPKWRKTAESILNSIDTGTLAKIFEDERRRSGVPTEEIRTVTDFRDISALGSHLEGIITLNPKRIHEYAERNGIEFRQALFSVYIHESTHAQGHNSVDHPTPLTFLGSLVSAQRTSESGYSRAYVQRLQPKNAFNLFNEGITDCIAAEVFDSYGIQTGDSSFRGTSFASVYLEQRALVESFIALLSRKIDIPTEVIWKSIKQGYFQGQDLQDSEMARLYNELALEKVMKAIEVLDSKTDRDAETRQLTERIALSSDEELPAESLERIRTYFKQIDDAARTP